VQALSSRVPAQYFALSQAGDWCIVIAGKKSTLNYADQVMISYDQEAGRVYHIGAPCSKLQGIFDPQGITIYSNRSQTPQQATGNALAPGFNHIVPALNALIPRQGDPPFSWHNPGRP
jgi:hypothetical protein